MENHQINTEETQKIESLYRLLNLSWITAVALTCLAWVGIHLYCPNLILENELEIPTMLAPLLPLGFLFLHVKNQSIIKVPPFESWNKLNSMCLAHFIMTYLTPLLVVYACYLITDKTGSAISAPVYIPLSLILMLRLKPSFEKVKDLYLKSRNQTPVTLSITPAELETPELGDQIESLHHILALCWKVALVLGGLIWLALNLHENRVGATQSLNILDIIFILPFFGFTVLSLVGIHLGRRDLWKDFKRKYILFSLIKSLLLLSLGLFGLPHILITGSNSTSVIAMTLGIGLLWLSRPNEEKIKMIYLKAAKEAIERHNRRR